MISVLEKVILGSMLITIALGGAKLIDDIHEGPSDGLRSAVSLYESGQYSEAVEPLIANDADPLIIGNAYYYSAESAEDTAKQISYYEEALSAYDKGIMAFPDRIDLKYNYETVTEALAHIKENQQEQNQQDQSEGQEDEQGQETQNQDDQQSQEQEGSQDSEGQNQQNQDSNQSSESSEDQQQESEDMGSGASDSEENDQTSEADQDSMSDEDKDGTEDQKGAAEATEGTIDEDTLNQILNILEGQEADSLKNNQEVIQGGQDNGNDW